MVNRWAMIKDGVVVNVCLWDGLLTTWQPPEGIEMQLAPDQIAIGWTYVNGEWIAPIIPSEEATLDNLG